MRISILGYHGTISINIGIRLVKEGHDVIYIGKDINKDIYNNNKVKYFNISLESDLLSEVFESINSDIIIFIYSQKEDINLLNDLELTLKNSITTNIKQYIYISTVDVYGDEIRSEDNLPIPGDYHSMNAYCGEKYFYALNKKESITYCILRVSSVYDVEATEGTFLNDFINNVITNKQDIYLNSPCTKKDFINVLDVADAVFRVAVNNIEGEYNIASGKLISFNELETLVKQKQANANIKYHNENVEKSQNIDIRLAKKTFDWLPIHNFNNDFTKIYENTSLIQVKDTNKDKLFNLNFNVKIQKPIKPYIEVILSFMVLELLDIFVINKLNLMYVDLSLIFVVIIGSIYGFALGIFAGLLTVIAFFIRFINDGYHMLDLIYNINYWIPFIIYGLSGAITGFTHDNYVKEISHIKKEKQIVEDKYDFMYFMFNEMRLLKNDIQKNLANYEGSLGKIYTIEKALNSLNVEELYYSAMKILEDFMVNETCSIYTVPNGKGLARLIVRSKSIVNSIPNYFEVGKVSYVKPPTFNNIGVFVNEGLEKDLPSYCASIYYNNEPIIFIMIWEARFEQYTHYYTDLFKLVSMYIGNALYRAYTYYDSIYKNLYLPESVVYSQEAFKDIISIKEQMKEKNMIDFVLLKINNPEVLNKMEFKDLKFIRATDFFGIGKDKNIYLFILMEGKDNISILINRLKNFNIDSVVVEELSNVV